MTRRLEKIFQYYNNKYNLNAKLEFTNYLADSYFEIETNKISILVPLPGQYSLNKMAIFSILHELKHAIDFYNNKERFLEEIKDYAQNDNIYKSDKKYNFGKRADRFANYHFKKWSNNLNKLEGSYINIIK